mgnify:CR=1 FL=1
MRQFSGQVGAARTVTLLLLPLFATAMVRADVDRGRTRPTEGWQLLFNGRNLSGWYTFLQEHGRDHDPDGIVTIERGMIHLYKNAPAGSPVLMGYIATEKEWSDYHLRLEYRWADKKFAPRVDMARDAGLYYHITGPDAIWPRSLQYQIEETKVGTLLALLSIYCDTWYDAAKGGGTTSKDMREFLDPADGGTPGVLGSGGIGFQRQRGMHERDSWNTVEIIVRGTSATHILNGHVVNRCRNLRLVDPKDPDHVTPLTKGRIALEIEAAEMFYRNVEIRSLAPSPAGTSQPASRSSAAEHTVESAMAAMELADPSLMIEPAATEPDVVSPVAVAWDEDERMYVVEMRDYPSAPTGGTIRRLEDVDGDGYYESAVIFADGLSFPSSCLPWRGGLLVTAAPDILYLKDTDGDGRADDRRVVLTGFALGDQQLRVNGLMFGMDGWVYVANGRLGGNIRRPTDPDEKAVSIHRNDIRFNPDTGEFQTIAGPSQFGLARDDWGNRFLSWNTIPIRQVVIEDRYLMRSPALQAESGIAAMTPADDTGRLYPITPPQRRFNRESTEYWNASCGPTIYRGHVLDFVGDAFICESLTSLVHRRRLSYDGNTITATRAEQGREFLASTDLWFRPVNLATGPDGALYVVDFVREEVEHPDFIPEHLREGVDFRAGEHLGRVWRIRRRNVPRQHQRIRLSKMPTAKLLDYLADRNGWRRDQVQRLLIERQDVTIAPALNAMVINAPSAETRLAALWTLSAMDDPARSSLLDDQTLRHGLGDSAAAVRRASVEIAESRLRANPAWQDAILRLAADADATVRRQVALTAGAMEKASRFDALNEVVRSGASDHWIRLAILSSLGDGAWPFLLMICAEASVADVEAEFLSDLARVVGATPDPGVVEEFMTHFAALPVSYSQGLSILSGFLEGLESRHVFIDELMKVESPPSQFVNFLQQLTGRAHQLVASQAAPVADRVRATRVLAAGPLELAIDSWISLLDAHQPQPLQSAAAQQLARTADVQVVARLLDLWDRIPTATQRELLSALCKRKETATVLLDAAESGRLSALTLRGVAGQALSAHPDVALRDRAARVFKTAGGDRSEVLKRYQASLDLSGDVQAGAIHFAKNCASCHRIQGLGQTVGPDLSGIASRTREKLLADILDPSTEIAPDYMNYIVVTESGEVQSGLLARETPAGVTLRQAQGIETTIARDDIAEFRAGGVSLMPEGLEETLDQQAVADLLAFLVRGTRDTLENAIKSATAETP